MAREELKKAQEEQIRGGLIVKYDAQFSVVDENTGKLIITTTDLEKAKSSAQMMGLNVKVITKEEYVKLYSPKFR